MKKDSFLKGTLVASIAIIITKIFGVLYVIPFYKIIGEDGGVLYSYAYNIYTLFLNISTAGLPVAISMIISEYLALNKLDAKERAYKIVRKIIIVFSIISFLILFIFSDQLALFFINGIEGATAIKDISLTIKAISFALLIAPLISVLRGYLQGHKFISPGSISQVYEQIIRIIIVLIGSYLVIKVFKQSITIGVSVALLGAFFGAIGAYIYLKYKIVKNKNLFEKYKDNKKDNITNKEILHKIIIYCVPLIIIAAANDLYNIIDMKLIIKGLDIIGFSANDSETIASIIATWSPKICMIIMAISMGLITSLIPHITEKYTKKDYKGTNEIFNQSLSTMLVAALPMVFGLILLKDNIYTIFYGASTYGSNILAFSAISTIFFGCMTVINTTLQGFKKFKVIILSILTGLVINTVLDIPFIILLNKLTPFPYFGTIVATILGTAITITIGLIYLKKKFNFKYFNILKNVSKTFIPLLAMVIVVIILKKLLQINILLRVTIIAIAGALTYISLLYKNKGLENTFGKEQVNKIMKKLRLKK